MTNEQQEKYLQWLKMSQELKALKTREMTLRKELCYDLIGSTVGKAKQVTEMLQIEAQGKESYKVDEVTYHALSDELTDAEKQTIKWTPSLLLTPFKKLPEGSILLECITSKPAAPTLNVKLI